MNNDYSDLNIDISNEEAKKLNDEAKQVAVSMAQAYHRLFTSDDGQRVLTDLNQRYVFNNTTSFDSVNVNYEAAYHNGEASVIKHIIKQLQQAKVI